MYQSAERHAGSSQAYKVNLSQAYKVKLTLQAIFVKSAMKDV